MSKFSNTNELNDMIDEFINNYASIFQNVVKVSMRNDLQKIMDKAKEEARAELYDHNVDKKKDANMINEDTAIWKSTQKYK